MSWWFYNGDFLLHKDKNTGCMWNYLSSNLVEMLSRHSWSPDGEHQWFPKCLNITMNWQKTLRWLYWFENLPLRMNCNNLDHPHWYEILIYSILSLWPNTWESNNDDDVYHIKTNSFSLLSWEIMASINYCSLDGNIVNVTFFFPISPSFNNDSIWRFLVIM